MKRLLMCLVIPLAVLGLQAGPAQAETPGSGTPAQEVVKTLKVPIVPCAPGATSSNFGSKILAPGVCGTSAQPAVTTPWMPAQCFAEYFLHYTPHSELGVGFYENLFVNTEIICTSPALVCPCATEGILGDAAAPPTVLGSDLSSTLVDNSFTIGYGSTYSDVGILPNGIVLFTELEINGNASEAFPDILFF